MIFFAAILLIITGILLEDKQETSEPKLNSVAGQVQENTQLSELESTNKLSEASLSSESNSTFNPPESLPSVRAESFVATEDSRTSQSFDRKRHYKISILQFIQIQSLRSLVQMVAVNRPY